jgi:hypothetical protein
VGDEGGVPKMYAHVNNFKNNKIKIKKNVVRL